MRVVLGVLWLSCLGCAGEDKASAAPHAGEMAISTELRDAGSAGAAADAARGTGDLTTLVAAFLTEYGREVRASCACRVEEGSYPSIEACQGHNGDPSTWIDCATLSFEPLDSPQLRATLRCNVELFVKRADCLESHTCKAAEMVACLDVPAPCPDFDPQALMPVIYNCLQPQQ